MKKFIQPLVLVTLAAGGLILIASAPAAAGGKAGEKGRYHPVINPADFTTNIDNPFLPLVPGTRMIYEGRSGDGMERNVVEVTRETRKILGVTTVVVHDVVSVKGVVIEDTSDWFAQDSRGNVWYFGEATRKTGGGGSSTEGSWEAGVNGAMPGIVMPAQPAVGAAYRQEYKPGHAEDEAEVLSLTESTTVRHGAYGKLLMTKEFSRLEPEVVDHKYYARGIGNILTLCVKGPAERNELVAIEHF